MDATPHYLRALAKRLAESMADTPVALLSGPRQAGKSTLARALAQAHNMPYLTLDDDAVRLSAQEDALGFLRHVDAAVIDEVQRAPSLLLAIKKSVDEDRRPGRFLLTGSANLMALPTVADSLAGRMETLTLLPLSQAEIAAGPGRAPANWLDAAFAGDFLQPQPQGQAEMDLIDRVLRGGYPELLSRATERRRVTWAQQYIQALMLRDVRDVAQIDKLDQLPRLLRALAQTAGQMCNYSQLGAQLGLDGKTVARYTAVFEHMYLLTRIEVWAGNRLKRMMKTPKLQFLDSGLLAALMGLGRAEVLRDRTRFGHLLESFVFAELLKSSHSADGAYHLMYYRDAAQHEVDVVIENAAGDLLGIEIKATASVREADLRGLKTLAAASGAAFKRGVVLYDGEHTLPLGHDLWALPISSLWGHSKSN